MIVFDRCFDYLKGQIMSSCANTIATKIEGSKLSILYCVSLSILSPKAITRMFPTLLMIVRVVSLSQNEISPANHVMAPW